MGYHTAYKPNSKRGGMGEQNSHKDNGKNCNCPVPFKQSDVYLFDEPFSALDAISEQHIIKRLNLKTKMSITIL